MSDLWVTREGLVIPVNDMTDSHLRNAIRYLEKALEDRPMIMPYMGNSDYAEDAVNAEEAHNGRLVQEIVDKLVILNKEERRRRK